MKMEPLLILENIHASYINKEVLRGISFEVRLHDVMAILGGNGSGKSTTLKVIAGVLKPTKGRIIYKNKDITTASPWERARMGIAFLLQGGRVFPNLSVEDNLQISHMKAENQTGTRQPKSVLGSIFPDLIARRGERAGLLSGGQRQMLAIEMVMARQSSLILMDEPTAALSSHAISPLVTAIANADSTILVVEHNIEIVNKCANSRIFLRDGLVNSALNEHVPPETRHDFQ